MDYNAIAQQLIDAFQKSSEADLKGIEATKRNEFVKINNSNNARGSLYSTQGGQQRTQFISQKYLPAVAQAQQKPLLAKLDILGQTTDIARQIQSMNRAADELNKVVFDY